MNTDYETILFDIDNHVARITLNRPQAANALNHQLFLDFFHAILHCDENPDIRAILITGNGKIFCAGGDLTEFAAHENLPALIKEVTVYFHASISRMARMDAPVIAAVNGTAGGAGMSLVCACDIVYAVESARFTMAYTRAGLAPDGSSTYFLPRIVGLKRAMAMTLTNPILSAQEAQEWGIVTRVLPDGECLDAAAALAAELASGPTKAYGVAKRLLQSSWGESLESQMEYEAHAIADMARTADAKEGITAFLEKRKPVFRGE